MSEVAVLPTLSTQAEGTISRGELRVLTAEQCRQLASALETVAPEQRQALSPEALIERFGSQTGLTREGAEEFLRLLIRGTTPAPAVEVKSRSMVTAVLLIGGILGGLLLVKRSLSPVAHAPNAASSRAALTREKLHERVRAAIAATQASKVVYQDVQGEGEGHWDPGPRYPRGTVNCIVWITQVLAEAYGQGRADKTPVLDRLRYYGGHVSFGTRKHYLAQSMALEPDPLKALPLNGCAPERVLSVQLQYQRFLRANSYSCPLYRADASKFDVKYIDPDGLLKCAATLKPGYYVMFGVATDKYDEMYGKESGPLGLVHGMFLEVPESPTSKAVKVHHASTAAKRVKEERLQDYVAKMRQSLHRGYALFEMDPAWDPDQAVKPDPEALRIESCERELFQRKGPRREKF